ncbi:MAG: TetR/AcrR family transcriptional regulator [Pirellula sp.]|jgi:AcrR family transcriptional regulator|nr:TetR/AcrR family transcriptional regulator [Pirellula sp.]
MVELTRKQREIERRTAEILRVSRPILLREGFHALSMDRVAAQMEYAKGTIYNHFPNKEEIVLALAVEAMQLRRRLFERAIAATGSSRVRMMAVGAACEFFTEHCSDDFVVEQWIRNNNIWDKTSEQRQTLIRECEGNCMALVSSVVADGVSAGELTVPAPLSPPEFVFGLWALVYGSQILTRSSPSLASIGIYDPVIAIRAHCLNLLNGFAWQPLMSWDEYQSQMQSLQERLIPEFRSIQAERQTVAP